MGTAAAAAADAVEEASLVGVRDCPLSAMAEETGSALVLFFYYSTQRWCAVVWGESLAKHDHCIKSVSRHTHGVDGVKGWGSFALSNLTLPRNSAPCGSAPGEGPCTPLRAHTQPPTPPPALPAKGAGSARPTTYLRSPDQVCTSTPVAAPACCLSCTPATWAETAPAQLCPH